MDLPPKSTARFVSVVFVLVAVAGALRISWMVSRGAEPLIGAFTLAVPCVLALILAGVYWTKSNRA